MNPSIEKMTREIIDKHEAALHPGSRCHENERGECAARFGTDAQPCPPLTWEPDRGYPLPPLPDDCYPPDAVDLPALRAPWWRRWLTRWRTP